MSRFYYGTRAALFPGALIEPSKSTQVGPEDGITTYVYLTANLDEAIWDAELSVGEGPGRIYVESWVGKVIRRNRSKP